MVIQDYLDQLYRRRYHNVVISQMRDGGGKYYTVCATSCIVLGGDHISRRGQTLIEAFEAVMKVAKRIESDEELEANSHEVFTSFT